jgi:hypothetical protein
LLAAFDLKLNRTLSPFSQFVDSLPAIVDECHWSLKNGSGSDRFQLQSMMLNAFRYSSFQPLRQLTDLLTKLDLRWND